MGRSYTVPRKVSNETRILVIFTAKSLITTIVFGIISLVLWNFILGPLGTGFVGIIVCICITAVGYGFGAITFPENIGIPLLKKFAGDNLTDLVFRGIKFKKKIYVCTNEREEKE